MKPTNSILRSNIHQVFPYDPLFYFLIFLCANGLLAYGPLTFQTELWLGLAGIILPLTLGFFHAKPADKNETPVYQRELIGPSVG